MIIARLQSDHPVSPAQVDGWKLCHTIDEVGLGIELLQVDKSWPLVTLLGQQVELIELGIAVKNLASAPNHALFDHAAADAEPIPIFQRALGEADRARALADAVGVIEQHHGLTALRQVDRQRQPDRPGADHDDGMLGSVGRGAILVGMPAIAELGSVRLRHGFTASGRSI